MSGFGGRGGGGAPRVRKVMTQAINLIFEFLKNVSLGIHATIQIELLIISIGYAFE